VTVAIALVTTLVGKGRTGDATIEDDPIHVVATGPIEKSGKLQLLDHVLDLAVQILNVELGQRVGEARLPSRPDDHGHAAKGDLGGVVRAGGPLLENRIVGRHLVGGEALRPLGRPPVTSSRGASRRAGPSHSSAGITSTRTT